MPSPTLFFKKRNMENRMDFGVGREIQFVSYLANTCNDLEGTIVARRKLVRWPLDK